MLGLNSIPTRISFFPQLFFQLQQTISPFNIECRGEHRVQQQRCALTSPLQTLEQQNPISNNSKQRQFSLLLYVNEENAKVNAKIKAEHRQLRKLT